MTILKVQRNRAACNLSSAGPRLSVCRKRFCRAQTLNFLEKSAIAQSALKGTGLASSLNNAFGTPELLDDLVDHWDADEHKTERMTLVTRLQVKKKPYDKI